MNVTMKFRGTCPLCRCRLRGFYIAPVRVNKATLRTTGTALSFTDPTCIECGFDTSLTDPRWVLDEESQRKVDAYRERKGWAA